MYCNTQTQGANQQLPNMGSGFNPMQNAMNSMNMFQQQQTGRPGSMQSTAQTSGTMPPNACGMNRNMNPNMPMGVNNMMGSSMPGGHISSPYSSMQPVRVDVSQQQQPQQQNQWQQQQQQQRMYGMNQGQQMPSQQCYSNNPYQSQMNPSCMQYSGLQQQQQQQQQPQQSRYRPH